MSKSSHIRQQTWTAPLAANATSLVSAHNLDGTTLTSVTAQPDFARILQLVASGSTTASVTINGTDINGATIAETIALSGTTPVYTLRAFATVTSIVLPTVSATTINIGIYTPLGLDSWCDENSFAEVANSKKETRQQIFTTPVVAANTGIHAAITLPASGTTVVTTAITNPDVPRTIRLKGNQSTTQALVVIIAGTNIQDAVITESVTMGGAFATPTDSLNAFKTVTSITVPTQGASGDTISVGPGASLGLDSYCDAYSFSAFAGVTSYTYSATVISLNVVIPSTSLNGSTTIALVYIPASNPKGVGIVSYTFDATTLAKNTITFRNSLDGVTDQAVSYIPAIFPTGRIWG